MIKNELLGQAERLPARGAQILAKTSAFFCELS
jgi:hypothetical protein